MWRGFLSSCRYSVNRWSDRWRPNHVFHQNRKGIRTISHPVAKKRIFWVRDIERLGLCSCTTEPSGVGIGTGVSDLTDMESRKGTIAESAYSTSASRSEERR